MKRTYNIADINFCIETPFTYKDNDCFNKYIGKLNSIKNINIKLIKQDEAYKFDYPVLYDKNYIKIYQGEKGLIRESMRTLLPDEIIDRKKSPNPKTHNPIYTKAVCKMLNDIAQDPNAKLFQIVDKEAVINMINTQGRSFTKPWFGQLMTGPLVIAYLIQLESWLNEYNVKLDI